MNSSASALRAAALDLVVLGFGLAVADIVRDRVVEEKGFLRHHADLFAQRSQLQIAHIFAVDPYRAGRDVVKARHQIHQRGFAAAAGADQRDHLAGAHFQLNVSRAKTLGARWDSGS